MSDNREPDAAADAFEGVRDELALLRHAVERFAAEGAGVPEVPDYTETLAVISRDLATTAQRVDALVKGSPPILTPEEASRQIAAASTTARREDHHLFLAARQGLEAVAARLDRHLQSDIAADEQRRRLWQTGFAGLALGMALWAIVAGPIARSMPPGWLWPERMAARSLRMPMWEGGQRLMRTASPNSFAGVLTGYRLTIANRQTLGACHQQAVRTKKTVRCTIKIEGGRWEGR